MDIMLYAINQSILRLCCICSRNEDFLKHSCMILFHFQKRGYPLDLLNKSLQRCLSHSRDELLSPLQHSDEKDDKSFILVTTFTLNFPAFEQIVKRIWDLLVRSSTKQLYESRIMVGYRRPKNLRDMLVRAKIPKAERTERTVPNCQDRNICECKKCTYCPLINHSGTSVSFTKSIIRSSN